MAHEIMESDMVFTLAPAWHGLEKLVAKISREILEEAGIFFGIRQEALAFPQGGFDAWEKWESELERLASHPKETKAALLAHIKNRPGFERLEGWKALIADLTHRLDLPENLRLIPLNLPKNSYAPITNAQAFDLITESLKDVDGAKIVSAGTLGQSNYFFVSVEVGESLYNVGKEQHKTLFNLTTSHNGTMALEMFPSDVRIVCMNTFKWSRSGTSEDDKWKVYHSGDTLKSMGSLSRTIQRTIEHRAKVAEFMANMQQISLDTGEMRGLIALNELEGNVTFAKTGKVSTQVINRTDEIMTLVGTRGIANEGKTLYNTLNAVTEFYTRGGGVIPKKYGNTRKGLGMAAGSSEFGVGADRKEGFFSSLLTQDGGSLLPEKELRSNARKGVEALRQGILESASLS